MFLCFMCWFGLQVYYTSGGWGMHGESYGYFVWKITPMLLKIGLVVTDYIVKTHSPSYNLTPPSSRVLIGQHFIFLLTDVTNVL